MNTFQTSPPQTKHIHPSASTAKKIRHGIVVPSGDILTKYADICQAIPREAIVTTMLSNKSHANDNLSANEKVDALCQWFSLVDFATQKGLPLQMVESVDEAWHAFILNTRLYREFCLKVFGYNVDHDPIEAKNPNIPREEYGKFTLWALFKVYRRRGVNPLLRDLAQNVTCCYFGDITSIRNGSGYSS